MFKTKLLGRILIGIGLMAVLSACETMQSGGRRQVVQLDDSVVTAKVKEALAKDPTLQKYDIQVQTVSGKVVLRGRVGSINDVYRAAEVVNGVEGVQFLLNDLSEK